MLLKQQIFRISSQVQVSVKMVLSVYSLAYLSVAIILIAYISNDTVKTQEDVEKYLGLSVLGTIPLTETDRKKKKKKQKQKKARGRR